MWKRHGKRVKFTFICIGSFRRSSFNMFIIVITSPPSIFDLSMREQNSLMTACFRIKDSRELYLKLSFESLKRLTIDSVKKMVLQNISARVVGNASNNIFFQLSFCLKGFLNFSATFRRCKH